MKEMIQSVINQTYEEWELCMADGSDSEHGYVGRICEKYAASEKRIKYKHLEKKWWDIRKHKRSFENGYRAIYWLI